MMKKVSFLGLGAMGSRMALKLLTHTPNHSVQLHAWNRTYGQYPELRSAGAVIHESMGSALAASDTLFSMVRDDEASREIWTSERLQRLTPNSTIIECSTLSPSWINELNKRCENHEIKFCHCPVIGSRPHAESGALTALIGADKEVSKTTRSLIQSFASQILECGSPESAACLKLAINSFFATQTAALAEFLTSIDTKTIESLGTLSDVMALPVFSPASQIAAQGMQSKNFSPLFPIHLVEKDLRYQTSVFGANKLPLLAATQHVFSEHLSNGGGEENIHGIVNYYL